jgi:gas vesicle protein
VAKQPKGELVPVVVGFNYDLLEAKVAEKVRSSADRIRERVKKTVEDIIEVGNDLLAVKEALEHGHFGPWLKAEFGWSERTAQNFMSVAERFKSAKFAELPIQPSAAYLLAAPAVPDEARQVAIEKAEAGEEITFSTAREIVAEAKKKKRPRRQKPVPTDKLTLRLVRALERYKERWNPDDLSELARHLREFAEALEKPERGGKKKAKG